MASNELPSEETVTGPVAELIEKARKWPRDGFGEGQLFNDLADEIERLQEIVTCPRLTITAPTEQITAVLRDWDKGRPVNTQDLINALAWRVSNQRREIARLNEALRRKISDEAPSFSPNFDERNGIR
jgi:hypothetical protein